MKFNRILIKQNLQKKMAKDTQTSNYCGKSGIKGDYTLHIALDVKEEPISGASIEEVQLHQNQSRKVFYPTPPRGHQQLL